MAIKLTADSFLAGVKQSGLIETPQLDSILKKMEYARIDLSNTEVISDQLVKCGAITPWQAEKLLLGKFKGFILGRYRLQNLLGRGEMSSIYLAEHLMMRRRCAIKVLPASKVKDTSYLGRFHREAQAVAALDHPNIVRAYDVDMEREAGTEIHFLVMEFVDGTDLEKLHDQQGEMGLFEAVDYIRQAAEGLSHAHDNGLVHRDIKPGNLLIDKKGVIKILDMGLARFFRQHEEESLTIKHDEKVLGTADYLAPEQAVDSHAVDERADIYALGCTLYFLMTGHPPFTDGTLVQRLLAHQTKSPPSIKLRRPETPDSLITLIEKMMEKRKEDRYQSAREVADALGEWLVHNGPRTWKQSHAQIVADVSGVEVLQGSTRRKTPTQPPLSAPVSAKTPASKKPTSGAQRIREAAERVEKNAQESREPVLKNTVVKAPQLVATPIEINTEADTNANPVVSPVERLMRSIRKNHRSLLVAGMILVGAVIIAGVSVTLQAKSNPEQPAPIEAVEDPTGLQ